MTVLEQCVLRGITELLHFTTNRGVVGTLYTKALMSRRRLPEEKYLSHVLALNSPRRREEQADFDKSEDWLDYVNLSVSEINASFLGFSRRWHQDLWWAILSFDSIIASHDGVYFATTNNSYDRCVRTSGDEGFSALFEPLVQRKSSPVWWVRRLERADRLTTCQQAEILYPGAVPLQYLKKIYVSEEQHYYSVYSMLRTADVQGVEVVVDALKFNGEPN